MIWRAVIDVFSDAVVDIMILGKNSHFCIYQRTQQQLIQVKSIEEFGIFGIIPASLMLSNKKKFRSSTIITHMAHEMDSVMVLYHYLFMGEILILRE